AYNIYAIIFGVTAGSFNLSSAGDTLTLTGGLTNNSANPQTLNLPVILGAPVIFNAASGDLTFSQSISNNGNPLTIIDGGHNVVMNGALSGTGGLNKIGPGTNTLS